MDVDIGEQGNALLCDFSAVNVLHIFEEEKKNVLLNTDGKLISKFSVLTKFKL